MGVVAQAHSLPFSYDHFTSRNGFKSVKFSNYCLYIYVNVLFGTLRHFGARGSEITHKLRVIKGPSKIRDTHYRRIDHPKKKKILLSKKKIIKIVNN